MKGFLEEGRKVEVMLGPKRKGRAATLEECERVLRMIMEVFEGCKGASVGKRPEGKLGGVMTMVFEGKRVEREKGEKAEKVAV